jgi:hypothetical protein
MTGTTIVIFLCGTGIAFLLAIFAGFYREAQRQKQLQLRTRTQLHAWQVFEDLQKNGGHSREPR